MQIPCCTKLYVISSFEVSSLEFQENLRGVNMLRELKHLHFTLCCVEIFLLLSANAKRRWCRAGVSLVCEYIYTFHLSPANFL